MLNTKINKWEVYLSVFELAFTKIEDDTTKECEVKYKRHDSDSDAEASKQKIGQCWFPSWVFSLDVATFHEWSDARKDTPHGRHGKDEGRVKP